VIVGIDVHKHAHAAALLDDRGGEIGTLTVPNSPEGYRRLLGWLAEHDAAEAVIGVESPGSYGRALVTALSAASHEVLHVPAWRTHRERHRQGPGKTDPGDALAIADVVRRKRDQLGPALEPELVRALAMLELQRKRFVHDRTQAIQRLRSDWTQVDPVAEAKVVRCDRPTVLKRLRRITFGDGLAEQIAAHCIRELARDIEDLNDRIAALEAQITELLDEHGNPVADLLGAGEQIAATLIAHAGDVRRFKDAAAFARYCGAAPIPAGPERRPDGIDSIAEATASSTPPSTGSRSSNNDTTPPPKPSSLAKPTKARPRAKPAARSNAISPTSSTASCWPGPTAPLP
jgi:transposase